MPKYNNRKTTDAAGETFDSLKERKRWDYLKYQQATGKISGLQRQVKFELIPAQRDPETGKVVERSCSYIADFVYIEDRQKIVEDVKGGNATKTAEYIMKRKLMYQIYGLRIREV